MASKKIPKELLVRLRAVRSKRPRTVIDHIVKHGFITTEVLKSKYGYNHPPRAARDVREQGIPLETFKVVGTDGRKIAAYRFGDLRGIRRALIGGRRAFSKAFKSGLAGTQDSRCQICSQKFENRYLQVDHRIPYEVAGEVALDERDATSYMLLCGSCNRAKSWSCEHCQNWSKIHDSEICKSCYWASPESYRHIAMQDVRRLDLTWSGDEVVEYDRVRATAQGVGEAMPDYVKRVLRLAVRK